MTIAVVFVIVSFLAVVVFALHRKTDVKVSMSIRRLFEFTIIANNEPLRQIEPHPKEIAASKGEPENPARHL